MFGSGADKEKIMRPEFLPFAFTDKVARARNDHVNFIAAVRRLRIIPARRVKFYG